MQNRLFTPYIRAVVEEISVKSHSKALKAPNTHFQALPRTKRPTFTIVDLAPFLMLKDFVDETCAKNEEKNKPTHRKGNEEKKNVKHEKQSS